MAIRFESQFEPIPGYRLLERLGSGGFGEVWKCEAPGGIFKAVKIIHGDLRSKDNDLVRYAEQELKAMKRVKAVRHPYLLAIDRYDIVEGRLLIVMELADCNLWDRFRQCRLNGLPGIPRDDLLNYMEEAAEVLDLMNFEHQLLHLDIKPQNIFLQYNHVKVGDFGQVKDLEGIMASVTGGITPVYAAPETFDGIVTRFCDQYSLACVYQELLSGQRPFDGTSMQQLLMQHLPMEPNLAHSPPQDRPALAKALAKKPEERFANCTEFVRGLRNGVLVAPPVETSTKSPTKPWATVRAVAAEAVAEAQSNSGSSVVTFVTTGSASTPMPEQMIEVEPPREPPPERTGDGPIRPALIIGLGGTGLRFLQRFRKQISERYGPDATPAVRLLFIDTDPDTLAAAVTDRSFDGLTPLRPEEIFAARLNRSTHYLKPRQTGRTLIEGWFDPQMLHRLPRNPVTQGLRAFGRLALCDHYRSLLQKIDAELDTCLTPEALYDTMQATGLELGSNRPRIYLAASLAGGTGGGMILDLAYILRNRLRKLGYSAADVVGLLFVPPDDPQIDYPPLMRINTVAALTELNHYTRPGNVFHSYYDDRHAFLRDPEPPFARLAVLPAPPPSVSSATPPVATTPPRGGWSGSRPYPVKDFRSGTLHHSSTSLANSGIQRQVLRSLADGTLSETPKDAVLAAADWTRLELFGSLGRIAAESRPAPPAADVPTTFCTWGMARFEWPRNEVVTRTARIISGVMLDQWVSPDPGRAREIVPNWTANLWQQVGLDLEGFIERLKHAANQAVQGDAETMLVQIGETAIPKGWLARTPDAAQVGHALVQWDQRVGRPIAGQNSPSTPIDDALRVAASDLATMAQSELSAAVPRLIDDPKFRLAGAEEAARQLIADLDRMASAMAEQADRLEGEAAAYYEVLSSHAYNTRLIRPASGSLVESLKQYPRLRYQALLARRAARTYAALKEALATVKNEVANCRQRLLGFKTALLGEIEQPSPEPGPRQVLPPGCGSIEDAAKKYLDVLTDDDLHQMEDWVQNGVERNYGGLYQACLNSAEGAQSLLTVLRNQTRAYLNARLGEVDLAAMFTQKYGPTPLICEAFRSAYADAHPDLITSGPWTRQAITIFAAPTGDAGDPLRHAACLAIPSTGTIFAEAPDEAVIYCEFPQVPLAALPHFGPAWQSAYDSAFDTLQCTPHTRIDVAQWTGIDAE